MRILHLDSGREMRGGQWQVLLLLRGLRDRGHELKLLARAGSPLFGRAYAEGFDVQPMGFWNLLRLRRWADIVHAHDGRTHSLAVLSGLPVVVARRVAFAVRTGWLSRWKYRRAGHYIAISRFVAGRLIEAGIKSEAISVVYDSVPPVTAIRKETAGLVVAPATADPMKGSDLVREAASIGGFEIRFSSDLGTDLPGAAVFLYITREEGLGSAALLAMAHGVPVAASRVGGLPEAVEDGRSGLLVGNDPHEIAAAVRTLLKDPDLAGRMGAAGREIAQARFSLERMTDETIGVYEKVLA